MGSRKKIMVIDDDEAILDVVTIMLEQEDFEIITSNSDMLLFESNYEMPDLILLDVRLSGIDGRTICKKLKNAEATKSIPVILFSANADIKEITTACGADGYVIKPFDKKALLAVIKSKL